MTRKGSSAQRIALTVLVGLLVVAAAVMGIYGGVVPPVAGLLLSGAVLSYFYWLMRRNIAEVLLVFFLVMLLMTILRQPAPKIGSGKDVSASAAQLTDRWQKVGPFDETLPVVIHIVLDELMSPGPLAEEGRGGEEAQRLMYEFGEEHAFRTFASVYSRYYYSALTMLNLFNAEYRGDMSRADLMMKSVLKFPANSYFDDMGRRGYRTAVFQTSFFDYCTSSQVRLCETFESFDPKWGDPRSLDLKSRKVHVWDTLLRSYGSSYTAKYGQRMLAAVYGLDDRGVGTLATAGRFDVEGFQQWFQEFVGFVAKVPRGTHVFAHFMVPHSPYLLTEECVVGGERENGYFLAQRFPSLAERAAARERYYRQYLAQVRCVMRSMDGLMDELERVTDLGDAKIIIHGDHGSRISAGNFLEEYEHQDFVDNFATYFAVRAPGVEPGVDCELVSLPEVFRRFSAEPLSVRPRGEVGAPLLVDTKAESGGRVEVRMPAFGCSVGDG